MVRALVLQFRGLKSGPDCSLDLFTVVPRPNPQPLVNSQLVYLRAVILGFLTPLCLIEIICFGDLLSSTNISTINTLEGK